MQSRMSPAINYTAIAGWSGGLLSVEGNPDVLVGSGVVFGVGYETCLEVCPPPNTPPRRKKNLNLNLNVNASLSLLNGGVKRGGRTFQNRVPERQCTCRRPPPESRLFSPISVSGCTKTTKANQTPETRLYAILDAAKCHP